MSEQTKLPDIVERLRHLFTGWKRVDDLSEEAADEIERLRSLVPADGGLRERAIWFLDNLTHYKSNVSASNSDRPPNFEGDVAKTMAALSSGRKAEDGEGLREAPDIERIILRRLYEKRIEGYTLEMSQEIAALSNGRDGRKP